MKYVLVTGGVISGIGKGVISSSLGTLFKSHGLKVTPIKIDPYINIDAGTFSPYEHGKYFIVGTNHGILIIVLMNLLICSVINQETARLSSVVV